MSSCNCKYTKVKAYSVPMSKSITGGVNNIGYYPSEQFNDVTMSENYFKKNGYLNEIGYDNNSIFKNSYKSFVYENLLENFENKQQIQPPNNLTKNSKKSMNYSICNRGSLGYSEIPQSNSTVENFGSYFMDNSYFNPNKEFGYK